MKIKLEDANKWYAERINKKVEELDYYDFFCAKVAYEYASKQLELTAVSQRSELLPLEDAKFIYNLLPKWVKEEPADGLSPTFYGTLTKEGDLKVQEQVKRILGNCG
jgi:hypothetical protein